MCEISHALAVLASTLSKVQALEDNKEYKAPLKSLVAAETHDNALQGQYGIVCEVRWHKGFLLWKQQRYCPRFVMPLADFDNQSFKSCSSTDAHILDA